jgi:PLP dependent protein
MNLFHPCTLDMDIMLESTQHLGDDPQLRQRIRSLCAQIPPSVQLIAVSKGVAMSKMRIAYEEGLRHFAENRVQELQEKHPLGEEDVVWHYIGAIQSNKVRKIVALADWIQSVESLDTLRQINRVAGELGRLPKILLQVKLAPDSTKGGWSPPTLEAELSLALALPHVDVRGLMTILPFGLSPEENITLFQSLVQWAERWRALGHRQLTELSMGMSGDYPQALAVGTTMVRLGQSLFGPRVTSTVSTQESH